MNSDDGAAGEARSQGCTGPPGSTVNEGQKKRDMKTKRHIGCFTGDAARGLADKTADEIVAQAETGNGFLQSAGESLPVDIPDEGTTMTSDGRYAVRIAADEDSLFAGDTVIDIYEIPAKRERRSEAEKLSIISEHLNGDETLDAVQRRHKLGHSTLSSWMRDLNIVPRNDETKARLAATEKEVARLQAAIANLTAMNTALRNENARYRAKIRAAREALVLAEPQAKPRSEEAEAA